VLRFPFYGLIFLPEEEEGLVAIDRHGNGHVWIAGESMDKSRPLNEFSSRRVPSAVCLWDPTGGHDATYFLRSFQRFQVELKSS
jgi:hypothetical protein